MKNENSESKQAENKMNADYPEQNRERTVSFGVKLRNFSDENKHKPGILTVLNDCSLEEDSIIQCIVGAYYGNGNNENNKGYVSLVFNCQVPLIFKQQHDFTFTCVVSIKDVTGNKKFLRTFTFPHDSPSQNAGNDLLAVYTIDRYISRETILDNRDDLLRDDALSLKIDVSLVTISPSDNSAGIESAINSSFEVEEDSEGPVIVLSLNSELAEHLYEESSVFRALCDNPMIESSTGLVHLPDDNQVAFKNASRIIMGARKITFNSFDDITSLYIFADKYDIQRVIRACHNFCNSILHVQNAWGSFDLLEERVEKISRIATFFYDDVLREMVDRFLKNRKDNSKEIRKKCEHRNINLGNLICEFSGESPYLYFQLEEENDGDKSDFEFYN